MGAPKGNGPDAANDRPAKQTNNAAILPLAQNLSKSEATLIAHFALKGFAVHRLEAGGYLVARWNLSRHCADLSELESFAEKTGVIG